MLYHSILKPFLQAIIVNLLYSFHLQIDDYYQVTQLVNYYVPTRSRSGAPWVH